jgi:hypothetical protein
MNAFLYPNLRNSYSNSNGRFTIAQTFNISAAPDDTKVMVRGADFSHSPSDGGAPAQLNTSYDISYEMIHSVEVIVQEELEDPPSEISINSAFKLALYLGRLFRRDKALNMPEICISASGGFSFNWLLNKTLITIQIDREPGIGWQVFCVNSDEIIQFELRPSTDSEHMLLKLISQ